MFDFDDFSISKREIIVSIAIIAIMIMFGLMIHGAINDALMLEYQEYNTALQINKDTDMFKYAMQTNIGNSFVYGDLKAVDTVTYPEIGGQYSYVEKVKERHTMHTRVVTYTVTVNGKPHTRTRTETYWTWDRVDSWSQHCNKISFIEVEFDYGKIPLPSSSYITTIQESGKIRYKYYGSPVSCTGTIYSDLRDNTINNTEFYQNQTIDETIEKLESNIWLVLFWIGWIILTGGFVFAFFYIDNWWLEDSNRRRYY